MILIPGSPTQAVWGHGASGLSSRRRSVVLCRGVITLIPSWCNNGWSSSKEVGLVCCCAFFKKSSLYWLATDHWVVVRFGKTCLPWHRLFPAHLSPAGRWELLEGIQRSSGLEPGAVERCSAAAWQTCNQIPVCAALPLRVTLLKSCK